MLTNLNHSEFYRIGLSLAGKFLRQMLLFNKPLEWSLSVSSGAIFLIT